MGLVFGESGSVYVSVGGTVSERRVQVCSIPHGQAVFMKVCQHVWRELALTDSIQVLFLTCIPSKSQSHRLDNTQMERKPLWPVVMRVCVVMCDTVCLLPVSHVCLFSFDGKRALSNSLEIFSFPLPKKKQKQKPTETQYWRSVLWSFTAEIKEKPQKHNSLILFK